MLLEPLCDVAWTADLMRSVEPSPRGDGRLFAQGTATFTGRLAGQARWSNSPRLRGGYAFPNAHGVLDVEDGGSRALPAHGHVVAGRRARGPACSPSRPTTTSTRGSTTPARSARAASTRHAASWPCATTPAPSTTFPACRRRSTTDPSGQRHREGDAVGDGSRQSVIRSSLASFGVERLESQRVFVGQSGSNTAPPHSVCPTRSVRRVAPAGSNRS